jgi:putative ABC transport system permease protein
LIMVHGLRLSVAGIVIGLASAIALTRAMRSMLVGVGPTDSMTYVIMGLFFFAIAAVSLYLPARRAAALGPTAALREN